MQTDPIGFGGGDLNLYAYVGNDPVNLVDPSGMTEYWNCAPGPAVNCTAGEETGYARSCASGAHCLYGQDAIDFMRSLERPDVRSGGLNSDQLAFLAMLRDISNEATICRLPTISIGGGLDGYAGVGGGFATMLAFNPKNGQLSLGLGVAVGGGGGGGGYLRQGAQFTVAAASEELPVVTMGIDLNAAAAYGVGIQGSHRLIGSNPGYSFGGGRAGPEMAAFVNISANGEVNIPAWYQVKCG